MGVSAHAGAFAPPSADENGLIPLIGLDKAEMTSLFVETGMEKFRAAQVWHWLYYYGVTDFSGMSNISKKIQAELAARFTLARPTISTHQISDDGTRKYLLKMSDGQEVEAVHIPEEDRGALCVSSQVGCTLTCRFCHTGTQPLVRNLSAAEILGQILVARDDLNEWPTPGEKPRQGGEGGDRFLTNIVMMGMGEPLYNYDNVAKALKICMDPDGIAISKRRITLSTSGVVPLIQQCGADLGVNLAVSLHAVTDEIRDKIMPINRKYPIADLMAACRTYPGLSNARRMTFEYVMLKGVNDSPADARALIALLKGIPAKVNLIPFNQWPGAPFECSEKKDIAAFATILNNAGYASPVRTPRGRDISAACGQLKSESQRARMTQRSLMEGNAAAARLDFEVRQKS